MIEKFNKNNKVNLYFTFYSHERDVTHNYYLQCPKLMIGNRTLKNLDANPLPIKSLGAYLEPIPLLDLIIFKYWGRLNIFKYL